MDKVAKGLKARKHSKNKINNNRINRNYLRMLKGVNNQSISITLPKTFCGLLKWKFNDFVKVTLNKHKIVLTKPKL